MILQTAELSPSQKAAIEKRVGRKLEDQENIVLCGDTAKVDSPTERHSAAERMRYELYLLDRSQRRPSIEESAAELLEKAGTTA